MANINGHEIFFGIVGQVDATEDKLPSWFPNVNPVQDLKDWWTSDLSEHYVDLCYKKLNGFSYFRVYSDGEGGTEIILSGDSSNSGNLYAWYNHMLATKTAYRYVNYNQNGEMDGYPGEQSWIAQPVLIGQTNDSSASNFYNMGYLSVIRKNESFFIHNYYNDAQIL